MRTAKVKRAKVETGKVTTAQAGADIDIHSGTGQTVNRRGEIVERFRGRQEFSRRALPCPASLLPCGMAIVFVILPVLCAGQGNESAAFSNGVGEAAVVASSAAGSAVPGATQQTPAEQDAGTKRAAVPCIEPPPLLRWQDYQGPFQKIVGTFAAKLELKSAHSPHYKPGTLLCSLEAKDKFVLFVRDTLEPISVLGAAFDAGMDQASNRDPSFGQGSEGYGKRLAADFATQTTWRFFTDFAYPTLFSEDPRYYRMIHGTGTGRFLHAVEHTFVAHRDNGARIFNVSQWLGTATTVALSDFYHPGNERGVAPALRAGGYVLATGMGFDVLREFWPDIARKLRMPFRDNREASSTDIGRSAR